MNIEKVKELRDVIASLKPEAFAMDGYVQHYPFAKQDTAELMELKASKGTRASCETVGCIAGWTCLAFATEKEKKMPWNDLHNLIWLENDNGDSKTDSGFFNRARKTLGLTIKEGYQLFLGERGGWSTIPDKDWKGKKDEDGDPMTKGRFILNKMKGLKGKKAALKQLDYMIKTGKV